MADKQRTIKKPVSVKGIGLHSGIEVKLTFNPATENHGYVFQRVDLEGKPVVKALVKNVIDTSRGTSIGTIDFKIGTVEHVLSSLYGLEIDNILIEVDGPEVPILDGSAKYYIKALKDAGITEQESEKQYYSIKNKISYTDEENGVEIVAYPDECLSVNVLIDYYSSLLVNQYATLDSISDYVNEISECRTYVFLHDLEELLKSDLIKGGGMENAIILIDREISQQELDKLADIFNKPRVKVKPQGVLNNIELYFNNEPARHKLLDMIGDLALSGVPIKGKIIARRPGHGANIEFVKILSNIIKKEKSKSAAPYYDPNATPCLDINQIKNLLPHRPPFLFVDKILSIDETCVIGLKNVTMNEGFFIGHFPDMPVMPGVLQVEAMAQVGGILAMNTVPDPENYSTLFMKIDNVKFRKQVVPGDTLIFKLELTSPIRRGVVNMQGKAFVGDKVVAEAEMMAQISKIKEE